MFKFASLLVFVLAIAACNSGSGNEDALLSQPPYDKLTDSIHREPENAELYFKRGTLLFQNEQTVLADGDFKKALQLNFQERYALRYANFLKQKDPDAAISFLQDALKKLPGSIGLHIMLAKGYESKNRLNEALALCDTLIAQYPGQLDALTLKAEILEAENKDKEALGVLETAYSYAPDDVDLVHQLAFEYAEAKNPKVLALTDSLIKLDVEKRHAEPYYFKGIYYSNINNAQEAIRQFDLAIQHDYQYLNAYINKGIIYYDKKQFKEALAVFQLASTVFPDEPDPYHWLGKTQEAMGQKDEARLNYQRAYGLDKTDTAAKAAADRLK